MTSGRAGQIAYRLYADPEASGDPAGKPLVGAWFSTDAGAVDNAWYSITIPHSPDAFDGSQFSYLLSISQEDSTAESISDFKVRVVGTLAVAAGVTFGFEGAVTNAFDIIFPGGIGNPANTTYDGNWSFRFYVPPKQPLDEVSIWDGDLDYGDGVAGWDTDDADTPPIKPGFTESPYCIPEGGPGFGSPKENNPNLDGIFARGSPVTYELVSPDGIHYLNTNPSGNQEWERFVIRTWSHPLGCSAGSTADSGSTADYCADSLSPGMWTVNIFGMDLNNVNYFHFDYGVLPGSSTAGLNGYVYEDLDRDGVFDGNEVGLEGVLVTLSGTDAAGNPVNRSTHTNSLGFYEFSLLPVGTYTVVETDPVGYFSVSVTPGIPGDGIGSTDYNTIDHILLTATRQLSPNNNFGDLRRPTNPGTGTPGYWKNHPEAWPVESITIGGVTYARDGYKGAIWWMNQPDGDKTVTMFRSLVCAKLNVLIGNDASCIADTIAAADAWMTRYGPVGSKVKANSAAWKVGEPLYLMLDKYNNGLLCAPSRG